MPEESEQPVAVAKPIPPRFWWLKRIAVGVVILLVALGGLRWWWGVYADRAFRAELDRYRATGEPIEPKDFLLPHVADDQNAVLVIKQALTQWHPTAEQTKLIRDASDDLGHAATHVAEVREILTASTNARQLLRRARSLPGADWGLSERDLGLDGSPPNVVPHAGLARLLCVAAVRSHDDGDDGEAVATLRDLLSLGRAVRAAPGLLPALLNLVMSDLSATAIERMAPSLAVEHDRPDGGPETRAAARADVMILLAELLDEQESHDAVVRSFYIERLCHLQGIQLATSGRDWGWRDSGVSVVAPLDRAWTRLLRPMFQLDGVRILRHSTAIAHAAAAASWPEAERRLPPPKPPFTPGLRASSRVLTMLMVPNLGRSSENVFVSIARRRMAAVALAIRLYELDQGRRPDQLRDLVPKYLPAIPGDPFADDGREIGYRIEAGRHVLCSVGAADRSRHDTAHGRGAADAPNPLEFCLDGDPP